jgi:TolA-binding protein
MKKLIALLVLLGVVLAAPAYSADEKQDGSLWERLRKKIEMLTPKKKISTTTAVGGVRGSQADADDVYWKGEAKAQPVDADELAAFKKAISLAEAGDTAGAQGAFADFLKKHPDSRLREDAEQALAQLQPQKQ